MRTNSRCRAMYVILISAAVAWIGSAVAVVGQDSGQADKPTAAKKAKKPGVRLPNYYAQVVDKKQREEIYKIQEEYAPKIAAIKAQLDAMTKERDEKIAAVLTPEQRTKVEEAAAAAKEKRAAVKSGQKETTPEPPQQK